MSATKLGGGGGEGGDYSCTHLLSSCANKKKTLWQICFHSPFPAVGSICLVAMMAEHVCRPPTISINPHLWAWWSRSGRLFSPKRPGPCFVQLVNPMTNGRTHRSRGSWDFSFNSLPSVGRCVYTSQGLYIGARSHCFLRLETTLLLWFRPAESQRDVQHFKDARW